MTPIPKRLSKEGVYLALGGGAARGLAHLGVLRAFEKHNIPIAGICGTSMGAVIGAGYALAPDADLLIHDFIDYIKSAHYNRARYAFMRAAQKRQKEAKKNNFVQLLESGFLLGRSLTTGSVISFENFQGEINALVPNKTFKDAKIPFFAVAVDLSQWKEVVFDQGLIRSAVLASAAIPGAFPPVCTSKTIYVDGGWMNKVPVNPLWAMGAEKIVAVDVFYKEPGELNAKRGYSLLTQANNAAELRLLQLQMERAAVVWRPPVKDLHWAEFTQVELAAEIGMKYAESNIDEVKRLLDLPPKPKWWVSLAQRMIPPKPREVMRFPFEIRGIWDVTSAEEMNGDFQVKEPEN